MFRLKKNSGTEAEEKVEAPRPEPVEEVPVSKAPPRRAMPAPAARPLAGPSFPIDVPRRTADVAPPRGESASTAREKSLLIGKDVRLKGEIFDCQRLIVEGQADITINAPAKLEIGQSGTFHGTADVAEAEVAGRFAGQLLVRGRLTVRGSGRIDGTVRYGQIIVEAGGQITGEVSGLTEDSESQQAAEPAVSTPAVAGAEGRESRSAGAAEFIVPGERP